MNYLWNISIAAYKFAAESAISQLIVLQIRLHAYAKECLR